MHSTPLPPPHRPLSLRAIHAGLGATLRASRGLGFEILSLSDENLIASARRATRLEDFGPDGFEAGLQMLLDSLEQDAALNPMGRILARRQILDLLSNRLRLIEHRRRHPEIAEEKIQRPFFVLGLPRSGTTFLHALLACDPFHRAPLIWEVLFPCPPPLHPSDHDDPRIARTEKMLAQLVKLAPGFPAIHPFEAKLPQECIGITAYDFHSLQYEMCFDISSYQDWLKQRDMRPSYRFHRHFLQHLQSGEKATSPGRRKRWVLKSPAHLGSIEALLSEYPDAMIVHTHRDPLKVIPSVSSLEYTMRCAGSDRLRPERIGEQQTRLWSGFLVSALEDRDRDVEGENRYLDVHHGDLKANPIDCVRRIYAHFDLALGGEALQRMRVFATDNPPSKHGVHHYSLENFGLDGDQLSNLFKSYCERFGIEREDSQRRG